MNHIDPRYCRQVVKALFTGAYTPAQKLEVLAYLEGIGDLSRYIRKYHPSYVTPVSKEVMSFSITTDAKLW